MMTNLIYEELREYKVPTYTGVVKWFDNERGYGFIAGNAGKNVFLHQSQVKEKGKDKDIHEGEEVSFDVIQGEKGPAAINVQKLS